MVHMYGRQEGYGFAIGSAPPADFDQHYVTGEQVGRAVATYEYDADENVLRITDPVWGEARIGDWPGDELIIQLYQAPALQRLTDVELLTLPRRYMTMPGTDDLSVWEHSWGDMLLTRRLIETAEADGQRFTDQEKLALQLQALLHDMGKDAFAHLIDFFKQGFGGPQNSHDAVQGQVLGKTGIIALLQSFGVDPKVVIDPEDNFVERPSPDLNDDRIDYGTREILRWVDPMSECMWRDAFSLDEQRRVVMKDKTVAKYFGLAYGLLATEHWGHPVHRLQMQLFGELIKGALIDSGGEDGGMHVLDRMRTIDSMLLAVTRQEGLLNNDLHALMLNIARDQRRIFAVGKGRDIRHFLRTYEYDLPGLSDVFPHPLQPRSSESQYGGVKPQNIAFVRPIDAEDMGDRPDTLDIYLPPLKARTVDPLFYDESGQISRLSEVDEQYASLMEQCRAIQAEEYVARIHLAPDAVAALTAKLHEVQETWEYELHKERTEQSRDEGIARMLAAARLATGRHVRIAR